MSCRFGPKLANQCQNKAFARQFAGNCPAKAVYSRLPLPLTVVSLFRNPILYQEWKYLQGWPCCRDSFIFGGQSKGQYYNELGLNLIF